MSAKLIVGLGNPGPKYERSRHNAGFMAVDFFAKENKLVFKPTKFHGDSASGKIGGQDFHILKPTTFMNNSGLSVIEFVNYHNIKLDDIIVVYDDMDLALGQVRLRAEGSSGGQNGMLSVCQHLGTTAVKRLRMGIGRPARSFSEDHVVDYVLDSFTSAEKKIIEKSLVSAAEALTDFLTAPFLQVMSKHNNAER